MHQKRARETDFSYTLYDWFNKQLNIHIDQSAGSSHRENILLRFYKILVLTISSCLKSCFGLAFSHVWSAKLHALSY